jgi:hypothetical protein
MGYHTITLAKLDSEMPSGEIGQGPRRPRRDGRSLGTFRQPPARARQGELEISIALRCRPSAVAQVIRLD